MSTEKKFPLSLIIRAHDQVSGPLTAITAKINAATGPMAGLGKNFRAFGEALNAGGFAQVGGALANVGSTAFGLAARFAGVAAGAGLAFGAIVKGAMDSGDNLATNADRVGMGIDAYASLRFAAEQADVSQEEFASSLDKLNKQMGEMKAGKGGQFLAFLNEISPALASQMKGAKTTEQGLALMTSALQKIPDPQRRAALSANAFGKSNVQMGEFLHQGSAAIQEQQAEFMRLHGSQEESARAAGQLDNATRGTITAFEGLRMAAAGKLFPALTKLADTVTNFVVKNREGIAAWAEKSGAAISAWVDSGGFDRLVKGFGDVASGIGKVIDFLGPMGTAIAVGAVAFAPLIASVGNFGLSLIGVMPQLFAFGGAVWTALAPIAPFIGAAGVIALTGAAIYKNWDGIKYVFSEAFNALKWAAVDAWATVKPILEKIALVPGLGSIKTAIGIVDGAMPQAAQGWAPDSTTAEAARPGQAMSSQANVSVSFENLPAGARVSSESTGTPVDLSLGYSVQP